MQVTRTGIKALFAMGKNIRWMAPGGAPPATISRKASFAQPDWGKRRENPLGKFSSKNPSTHYRDVSPPPFTACELSLRAGDVAVTASGCRASVRRHPATTPPEVSHFACRIRNDPQNATLGAGILPEVSHFAYHLEKRPAECDIPSAQRLGRMASGQRGGVSPRYPRGSMQRTAWAWHLSCGVLAACGACPRWPR